MVKVLSVSSVECRLTKYAVQVWNCMVVDSSSARGSLDDHEYVALPGTSHKTVCKHRTIQSVGIVKFVELIKKVATALDPAPLVVPISTNENAYSGTAN